jgi:hypothetical protein
MGLETVQRTKYAQDLSKMQVESACQGFVEDLDRFLTPIKKFTSQQIVDKFKELFVAAFGESKKLELVEVPLTGPTEGAKSEGRALAKTTPRSLALNHFPRTVFKLVTPGKQVLGLVDFSQISDWTMVVNAKVDNQFSAKSFLSFVDTIDNAIPSLDSIVNQLKETAIPETVTTADLEGIIRSLMTDIDCVDPQPEIKSSDKYSVLSWIKGQKVEVASAEEQEGFRRDRKLVGETCPFNVLTISFLRLAVDGFPTLQVYFEGNTAFPVPIYLDYFLVGDTKDEYEAKIKFIFDKFATSFKDNEAARKIEAQKDEAFDLALKDYKTKVEEYLPGSENLKMPERETVTPLTMQEAASQIQHHILKTQQLVGSKQPLMFISEGPVTAEGNRMVVKTGVTTLMMIDTIKDTHPRLRVTFFYSPNSKGERTSTYQMDFSTDPRLQQFSLFDAELVRYFKAAWKKAKSVL